MTVKTKKFHLFLDITIAILVILLFILFDLFYVSLKTAKEQVAQEVLSGVNLGTDSDASANPAIATDNFTLETIAAGEKVFVPILNFHHIAQAPAGLGKIAKSYYLTLEQFEKILKDLQAANYQSVFVSQLTTWLQQGVLPTEKIIALTFDDGNEDFYTQAWPLLQQYQFKSSMYIMTGVGGSDYLTKEQIMELDKSGLVEFGAHTVWHPKLTKISVEEQRRELVDSKKFLGQLLNKEITTLCYPFGLYNDEIKQLAGEVGYQAALTFDQDAWQNPFDLLALKRISVYPGLAVINFLDKLKNDK